MKKKAIAKHKSHSQQELTRDESRKLASERLEAKFGLINFSDLLISSREIEGMTQAAMSRRLSISSQRLCDFEKGRRLPSPKSVEKMAKKLGYHPAVWIQILLQDQLQREKVNLKVSVAS